MQTLNAFIRELAVGIMNSILYFPAHARVEGSVNLIHSHLKKLQEEGQEFPLTIGIAEDRIVHGNKPLLGASLYAKKLTHAVMELETGGIKFEENVKKRDISFLLGLLSQKRKEIKGERDLNANLHNNDIKSLQFVAPFNDSSADADELWKTLDELRILQVPVELYQDMIDLLQTSAIRVVRNIELELDRVYEIAAKVLKILKEQPEVMLVIACNEESDDFNLRHSIRVCLRTCLLMKSLVSDRQLLLRICRAALLHDIGKALVPQEILFKPGSLTQEEREEMMKHPELGARILLKQENPDPLAVQVAFGHHITHDGRGYPVPPQDFQMDAVTQLLQVCDVFEALTTERPYKAAYTPLEAYKIMLGMKSMFHPGMLSYFIKTTGLYPLGTILELTSGEVGQVVFGPASFYSTRVRILRDETGHQIPLEEQPEFDLHILGDEDEREVTSILRSPSLLEGLLV